jgi:outer membrane lipoprotein LolB
MVRAASRLPAGPINLRLAPIAAIAGLAALLAGCPSMPRKAPTLIPWPERRAQLQTLESYVLQGRVAVAAGSEGFSARLHWEQQGARTSLALDGPLGMGGVRVVADGTALNVTNSQGTALDSDAARAELRTRLGFDPPLASLRYWVLGVPDPAMPATENLDAQQRLASLSQDGWDIQYTDYVNNAGGWLPRRLSIQREGVRVRLIVDDWHA